MMIVLVVLHTYTGTKELANEIEDAEGAYTCAADCTTSGCTLLGMAAVGAR